MLFVFFYISFKLKLLSMIDWSYSDYSKVNPEILKYFPFKKARHDQLETISEIINAINKGFKYIILEAGTGTGKSAIAATLSRYYSSSYILTKTKHLQNQYLNDFSKLGFKVVKGRGNFYCKKYIEDGIKESCDRGRCIIEGYCCEYASNNICDYHYQKNEALNSSTVISNYHYLFLELNYVGDFTKRNLIVFDEAHNLENVLMNQLMCEFSKKDLKKYVKFNLTDKLINKLLNSKVDEWILFIEKIKSLYSFQIEKEKDPEIVFFMKSQVNSCNNILADIKNDSSSWICDYDNDFEYLQFKPLKIDNYAKNSLFNHADICLFMSATILDYKLFAKWMGISQSEIYPIRKKSPFNISNNPIKTFDDFNLSYKNIKVNALKTVSTINDILNKHENEKGIIHTISSSCQDFLVKNINNSRLISHDSQNIIEQFEKFKKSKKSLVLVSPSIGEGVDLPGDLCRFQIMFKLPRPDWGDKQINLRSKMDLQWYDYKTCLNLVQMHGRGMRFDNDFCKNYFIDNRLKDYIRFDSANNNFLPDTFKNAIDIDEKTVLKEKYIAKINYLLKNNQYEKAIGLLNSLISNKLFRDDYWHYLMLSQIYHMVELYEQEALILTKFLKAGIKCESEISSQIQKQLFELEKMGYFDYTTQSALPLTS